MNADHKSIKDWMNDVGRGVVRLPSFQRDETWNHSLVSSFIEAVLQQRPLGVFLVLRVDPDNQPFLTRPVADSVNNGEKCREHLLDGQQRLMALWRAFKNTYDGYAFYAKFEEKENSYEFDRVVGVTKGKSNLRWIGNPGAEFSRQYIPIPILEPGEEGSNRATNWKSEATEVDRNLNTLVDTLRSTIGETLLPYLPMPVDTPPDEAIETFIKANTSSVRLNAFEIAVAQFEYEHSSQRDSFVSLRNFVDEVRHKLPELVRLEGEDSIGDLILRAACVKQSRKPTHGNYKKIIPNLDQDWSSIFQGMKWATRVLRDENIWDSRILPSTVPIRVLSALYPFVPKKGDEHSQAMRLVRSYLWRSFATNWYARQANDRLLGDFKALRDALMHETYTIAERSRARPETVFDTALPDEAALLVEGWPKSRGTLKRAILAVSTIKGALDMESARKISDQNIGKREYHHVFPDNLLKSHAEKETPNLALNCMLLEAPTNNNWRDEWPGDYLMERVKHSGIKGNRAKKAIEKRLASHCIPSGVIMGAQKEAGIDLASTYREFLQARAEMILSAFRTLCEGEEL